MHLPAVLDKHVAAAFASLDVEVDDGRPALTSTPFMDTMCDLSTISSAIASTEEQISARREQWPMHSALEAIDPSSAVSTAQVRARSRNRSHGFGKTMTKKPGNTQATKKRRSPTKITNNTKVAGTDSKRHAKNGVEGCQPQSNATRQRRKKDDDALDCIYAELQDSAGMCRYWGKKCWNLRVPKPKGGFHSLCHFHRAKANDNQRRFDYKRRGTLWREFETDPDAEDVSLFPLPPTEVTFSNDPSTSGGAFTALMRNVSATKFEPFTRPVALQDQDVELLQELVGCAGITGDGDCNASWN